MNFTFGIITAPGSRDSLQRVLASIEAENIHDDAYEVIVVGGDQDYENGPLRLISFDETKKKAWITRKKNIITEQARFENIVYMHDYVTLQKDWYRNFEEIFGGCFDVCMTPILNADGTRFRDWTLWPHDITPDGSPNLQSLLPYDVSDLSKFMYISGAYWIAKRRVMQEFPLDESLSWGESEDVKWSKQVREKYNFKLNPHSSVKLLKQKDPVFSPATPELIQELRAKNATLQSK